MGSGLKNAEAVVEVPDPLEVLERLLASGRSTAPVEVKENAADEARFEEELDLEGLGLRDYLMESPLGHDELTVEECR